ncbi:putative Neuropeptide Y receptor [Hypsibius exemplaris]|uniref:Neuropeptide Y receptor n=1 Tax=Hypsibius exemplaris TaxID=2072580 RepID=A0A1W0WQB2_HYPEX|nr:putative Neuropeptide Y receptor [Hypsibius exemplaris]
MNFELDHHPGAAMAGNSAPAAAVTWPPFFNDAKDLPPEILLAFQKHRSAVPETDGGSGSSVGLGGGDGQQGAGLFNLEDLAFPGITGVGGGGGGVEPNWEELMDLYLKNSTITGVTASSLEMSDDEQLFLTILYGAAIAIAVAGNLAVILVFLFGRRWNSDLSIFLVNLAFSDIVLSVFCMPFTMSQVVKHHWQFSDALCPIVLFLQLSSVIASVYTLVAIGVDRYLFVTRPLKARLTKRKGKMVIGCIWMFALALSSVQLAVVRCIEFPHNGVIYKDCQESWPNDNYRKAYTVTVALLTYIIPLTVLMFTYIRVGRILWQRTPPGETVLAVTTLNSAGRAEERRMKSKQRVVKMLVVIVLVFAICWFPLHLFFIVIDFFPEVIKLWRDHLHELPFTYTFLAIHFLAMSSSYVNPLIYSFMNQNFRSDVRQLWHRASSAIKHCFRRLHTRDGYDSEDDESIQPFRRSPNSGLHRSSSTPPQLPPSQQEFMQRIGAPVYPLIEQLSGRTGSECSKTESQACVASNHSTGGGGGRSRDRSRDRDRSSDRMRKENNYG